MLKYLSKQSFRITCLFLFMFSLSGCGKLLKQPEVNIASIQVKRIKNLEAVFRVNFEVYNPNYVPFRIKHIECDVEMEDKHIASAVSDEKITIPARGSGIVPVDVNSNSIDLISVILKAFKTDFKSGHKKIEYNIHGKILLGGFFYGHSTISFNSSGNLLEKFGHLKK